jgi:hypothetical protein
MRETGARKRLSRGAKPGGMVAGFPFWIQVLHGLLVSDMAQRGNKSMDDGLQHLGAKTKGAEMTLICRSTADIEPLADLIAQAESPPESGEISERDVDRLLAESRERARKEREHGR